MLMDHPSPEVSALSKPVAAIRNPELVFALDYWNRQRQGRSMPARGDLDPMDFSRIWPQVILLDVEGERQKVRLIGTEVVRMFGREITGCYMDEIDLGNQQETILSQYRHVVQEARPYIVDQSFRDVQGRLYDMERLILPLSEDGERVSMLFAVLSFNAMHGLSA